MFLERYLGHVAAAGIGAYSFGPRRLILWTRTPKSMNE
jgi:hypothetical protein